MPLFAYYPHVLSTKIIIINCSVILIIAMIFHKEKYYFIAFFAYFCKSARLHYDYAVENQVGKFQSYNSKEISITARIEEPCFSGDKEHFNKNR